MRFLKKRFIRILFFSYLYLFYPKIKDIDKFNNSIDLTLNKNNK